MVDNSFLISIAVAILVILASFLIFHKIQSKHQQHSFLIVGPSGSGKTLLFHRLTNKKLPVQSVTNIEPNDCHSFRIQEHLNEMRLVDYPGHNKLLQLYLYTDLNNPDLLKSCKGLIYMIDSVAFTQEYCELVAQQLFQILNKTETLPNGVDILFACNKNDLFMAKPIFQIKEMLEKELDNLRQINLKNLSAVSEKDNDNDTFFSSDRTFSFDQLEGNFDFIGGNVIKGTTEKWECWIAERAVN